MGSLITELRRRDVFKIGIAYLVIAWLLVQVVVSIEEPLHLPDWVDTLVIVLLAIGFPIALVIAWAFERSPEGLKRTSSARADSSRVAVANGNEVDDDQSIAVLPFADMSPDKDQEYFADGITEELLNSLAQIKDLRVAGRTSSFFFKGKNEDLRAIGSALGVRYILEGSVRKAGDRVRITAQLIDASSDRHLWSEQYDRTLEDLFEIQGDIARSVADALEITLGVGGLGRIPGMTRNVAAYDEYLKAGISSGNLPVTPEAARAAVQHLEIAVALDPEFAVAWATIFVAYEYANTAMAYGLANAKDKADEALENALESASDSPFISYSLMLQKLGEGDWPEAARYMEAIRDSAARHSLTPQFSAAVGSGLFRFGRVREALDFYERARTVDPLNSLNAAMLADAYLATGDVANARAEVSRFQDYTGHPFVLIKASGVQIEMATGDRAALERRLEQLIESDHLPAITEAMRDRLDDPPAALAEIRRMLTERAYQSPFIKNIFGLWAAYFGEPELALQLIRESTIADNNRMLIFSIWRAVYRDVRKLPEFKTFLEDSGMVGYFRSSGQWGDYCRPVDDVDFEVIDR